jgi:hypothetical protein
MMVTAGGSRTITWPRDPAAGAPFKIQISEDLDDWTDLVAPHADIDESVSGQVTFTLPAGSAKTFCRLAVAP